MLPCIFNHRAEIWLGAVSSCPEDPHVQGRDMAMMEGCAHSSVPTLHSVSLATGFSQPPLLSGHQAKLAWLGDGTHRAGCSPASTPAVMLCWELSQGVAWRGDRSAPAASGHHPIMPLGLASGNLKQDSFYWSFA